MSPATANKEKGWSSSTSTAATVSSARRPATAARSGSSGSGIGGATPHDSSSHNGSSFNGLFNGLAYKTPSKGRASPNPADPSPSTDWLGMGMGMGGMGMGASPSDVTAGLFFTPPKDGEATNLAMHTRYLGTPVTPSTAGEPAYQTTNVLVAQLRKKSRDLERVAVERDEAREAMEKAQSLANSLQVRPFNPWFTLI